MDNVLELGKWLLANYQVIIESAVVALGALIALAMLIPGDQPEKALQSALDFLSKFSRKPKQEEPK